MSSTHAIKTHIDSTESAESLFDGISYGKGSAFLKQFYKVVGYDTFKAGLHTYFARHAWGNTTLPDFVNALDEAYKK
jgi:aminopeptidase N